MVKLNWIRLTATFTAFVSLPTLVAFSDPAGKSPDTLAKQIPLLSQDNLPPASRSGGSRMRNNPPPVRGHGGSRSWEETFNETLLNNEPPRSRGGGSRAGGILCAITPMDDETGVKLWNNQPIFVWQGQLVRLELRHHDSEALIWSQDVAKTDNTARYTGEPLQPGERYTLWFYTTDSYFPDQQVIFQLLNSQEQERVHQELQQLDEMLKRQNATTDAIAQVRFQYFARKQLWSDAISEPFWVQNPSENLNQFKTEILPQKFCD